MIMILMLNCQYYHYYLFIHSVSYWLSKLLKWDYNFLPYMSNQIFVLSLLVFAALCSQDVPIQSRGYGFSVGDPDGLLHIQFFLDFQCGDSKASYNAWTNVRKTLSLQQNRIKLTYNFNPLPYHFYAAWIHQAFFYILKKSGTTAAEDYISYVFNHQDDFTQQKFLNATGKQFVEQFSSIISKTFNVNASQLAKQLVIGSDSFKSLKDHWRYSTIINGVSGTPIFTANGVVIDGAEDFAYQDWINFIKQYKS